jgi:hypothetical protein
VLRPITACSSSCPAARACLAAATSSLWLLLLLLQLLQQGRDKLQDMWQHLTHHICRWRLLEQLLHFLLLLEGRCFKERVCS